jgi:hypothetical protein
MSLDKQMRELIQAEVQRAVAPIQAALEQLQATSSVEAQLRALLNQSARRGPGRPPKPVVLGRKADAPARRGPGRPPKPAQAGEGDASVRGCAIIGCKRPNRSKGYCAAHYQKLRMLTRTKRLPSDWVVNAQPQSVEYVVLPRGRAGTKAPTVAGNA